jgi:membrane protease YdiL (CAAX protease family)
MENPEKEKSEGALTKQPLLIFIWAVLPIISVFGISMASDTSNSEDLFANTSLITMSLWQIASVMIMLVLPALLISYIYKKQVLKFLNLLKLPSLELLLLSLGIMFSANFFINYLLVLNKIIPLSAGLALKFEAMHNNALASQDYFLNFNGGLEFLLVFLTMAIIPAIAEEMYFRGLLEGILLDMKVGAIHAILISSMLFAMMHFQFYFLLPLLFMGGILGYVYYRTRNLWLSIAMHFMNNGLIVIVALRNKTAITPIDLNTPPPLYISGIGLLIFVFLLYFFHKKTIKN